MTGGNVGQRHVGRSGLVVSEVILGTAGFRHQNRIPGGQPDVDRIVATAVDGGITTFDTADSYGDRPGDSESALGEALKGRRDRAIIATKFGAGAWRAEPAYRGGVGSTANVRRAVEQSLRRLQTDWIDLYSIHQPDASTPLEETLAVLEDLIREGKIRYAGASNLPAWQIAHAAHLADRHGFRGYVSHQNEYNLLWRAPEYDVLKAVAHFHLGFFAYFPLQNGLLTGKYSRAAAPADGKVSRFKPHLLQAAPWDALERLGEFAAERGITPVEVAYGWLLAQPGVSGVITGATSARQVEQNASASSWRPNAEEDAYLRDVLPDDLSGKPGKRPAPTASLPRPLKRENENVRDVALSPPDRHDHRRRPRLTARPRAGRRRARGRRPAARSRSESRTRCRAHPGCTLRVLRGGAAR